MESRNLQAHTPLYKNEIKKPINGKTMSFLSFIPRANLFLLWLLAFNWGVRIQTSASAAKPKRNDRMKASQGFWRKSAAKSRVEGEAKKGGGLSRPRREGRGTHEWNLIFWGPN